MHEDEIEFGHYGRIARRAWWVLAAGALLGALAAMFLVPGQEAFFESRISVLLTPSESDAAQGQDSISEETEIGIAISQVIGGSVTDQRDDLELAEWSENLVVSACLDNESAVIVNDSCSTRILEFRYQADTAAEAQEVVKLTAETYLEFRQDREQALLSASIANLETELGNLETRGDTDRVALIGVDEESIEAELIERSLREIEDTMFTVISQLTELRSRSVDVGGLLGDPSIPEEDSSGIPFLFALVAGALLGLMVAAVIAIGLDRRDRRVSDASELESDLGVPLIGDIPRITQDSPALVTAVSAHTPGAEAFRRVAAAALSSRNGRQVSSIAIVGANENEGRTTTTINLALAMSQTGRDVLIVNTDRRSIVIDRIFGLVGEAGLNDFLRSKGDRAAAHMAIENASQRLGIRLLSSGTGTASSLSSASLQTLIQAAAERNMTVLFDTPPALTHAGGLQIAAIADAVYVVAAAGQTRRSELKELIAQLENVQANIAGAVFNRTSRLNLLPAGQGDIAAISIPAGVPGNNKNAGHAPLHQQASAQTPAQPQQQVAAQPQQQVPAQPQTQFDASSQLVPTPSPVRAAAQPYAAPAAVAAAVVDPARANGIDSSFEQNIAQEYASEAPQTQGDVESFTNLPTGLFDTNLDGDQS